jgi:hypothetical protein
MKLNPKPPPDLHRKGHPSSSSPVTSQGDTPALMRLWHDHQKAKVTIPPAPVVGVAHRVRPPIPQVAPPTAMDRAKQAGRFVHHYFLSPTAIAIDIVWTIGELALAQPIFDGIDRVRMKVGWVPPPFENCAEYNRAIKLGPLDEDRVRRSGNIKVICVDQPATAPTLTLPKPTKPTHFPLR